MRSLVLIFLFLFNILFASSSKEILLLHSYHKGYIWSDDISKTIEKKFAKFKNIELTTAYMDTKRVASEDYFSILAKLYERQFLNRKFDLVIVSDNNAFDFMKKYHKKLFKNIPILFCGINNFNKKMLEPYMSGVVEQVDLQKNIDLILKLHPKLKNLLIINDKSKTGLAIKNDLLPLLHNLKNIKIEYIDNLEISQLKQKIQKLDKKNSAMLFVLLFKDTTGKYFTYKQSFKEIKDISNIPIYGLWDFYLGKGIVGGLLTSAIAQGEAVSKMALEILDGKNISQIPILENSPNLYMFDYEELSRFNIKIDDFIKKPIIINTPKSIYKENKKFFMIFLLIIFILSIIVLILRANIQKRKKVEVDLSNRLEFDKVLLDTIPNPIYYKNKKGRFLGCNLAFANLVNSNKDEVIGKTAFDFFPKEVALKNTNIDKNILKTFQTISSEFTFYTPSKQMKHIILNKAVYKNIDKSVGGIVCIMDDISERIQQKQFLIQQSKLAEMGDMIAAIAHQWNEPLVELSAQVQDIQTSYLLNELQDIQVKDFVNDSMVQIKYMSRTLDDFRNFLKPSVKKQLFSIRKAFEDINEIIGKQVFYSNIKMSFNYKNKDEEILIYGYKNEFKQVLLNLINNAKNKILDKNRNTNNKGLIKIDIQRTIKYNIIKIIDDGGLIDENIIKNIFDPYFTTKQEGTGLGLYMAKVIIEDKMKGKISVENYKKMVIFTIKLPHKEF